MFRGVFSRCAPRRRDALALVAAGADPSAVSKANSIAIKRQREAKALADAGLPGPGTFEYVALEWLATVHRIKVSKDHADTTLRRMQADVFRGLVAGRSARLKDVSCCNALSACRRAARSKPRTG